MANKTRALEQHIAVFGESGSGKTVMVSSFFGPTQDGSYKNELWDLIADDTGQGNRLYQNYLGMRDQATVPMTTRFATTTYNFSVKPKGGGADVPKTRPFDALRLVWHDYPGEWFEAEPNSPEERARRTDTFRSLLHSDVAMFLVDGQKLLDYQGEEERYLKSLFGNLRQNLLRQKDHLLDGGERLTQFPRIWILALSKADLFPDWDVDTFRDLVILKAAEDIDRLRSTLEEFIETSTALSVGEDFMLLSSAKFELKSDDLEPIEIDLGRQIGVDLILPIASLLPLERLVQWHEKMDIPRKVADKLASGAELLAVAMADEKFLALGKVLILKVPKAGQWIGAAGHIIAKAAKLAGPKLKEMNEQARLEHDYLRATVTQFARDLERGVADGILRKPK